MVPDSIVCELIVDVGAVSARIFKDIFGASTQRPWYWRTSEQTPAHIEDALKNARLMLPPGSSFAMDFSAVFLMNGPMCEDSSSLQTTTMNGSFASTALLDKNAQIWSFLQRTRRIITKRVSIEATSAHFSSNVNVNVPSHG